MENSQNLIKRLLVKKNQTKTKDKLKSGLNTAENALNDLAQGGSGDVLPNPYLNARRSWNEITAKQSWQFIACF